MHTLLEDLLCDARLVEENDLNFKPHCTTTTVFTSMNKSTQIPMDVFYFFFFQITSCSYFSLIKRHLPCPAGVSCEHTHTLMLTGPLPSMATGSLPVRMHKPVSHSMCSCNRAHLLGKISISKVATQADSSLCLCIRVCVCARV